MLINFYNYQKTIGLIQNSITLFNFFTISIFVLLVFTYKLNIQKTLFFWLIVLVLFLVCSTTLIPKYLVKKYENNNFLKNLKFVDENNTYYLHVLGAGCSLDRRLTATQQLSDITLLRLIEAIRISKYLPNYKIVTSGNSSLGLEPQASVVKRAAIELGIPEDNIEMLTTPSNTAEEVVAFVNKFGVHKNVIVVTDAIHLPRALMLYKKYGIKAFASPSNFRVKEVPNDYNFITFPCYSSLELMNEYLREQLKYLKDSWFAT